MTERRDILSHASRRLVLDGDLVSAELITRAPTGRRTPLDLLLERHLVLLHLSGASPGGEFRMGGGRWRRLTNSVGRISVIPAGMEVRGWADYPNPITYVVLRLDPLFLDALATEAAAPVRLGAVFGLQDPVLRSLLQAVAEEVRAGDALATAALAGLARAVVARLARRDAGEAATTVLDEGLPRSRMRRLSDFVDSRLADPPSVAELAGVAGLSPTYFARRFRQGVGISPHAFVLRRRVEAARRLLATTRLPIGEVARATGFPTAAHFAATLRRLAGVTPSALRAEDGRQRPGKAASTAPSVSTDSAVVRMTAAPDPDSPTA